MNHTQLTILYEDKYLIVCKKPPGIATQSKQMRTLDLESLIKRYLYQSTKSEPYLAVIHRLDQPVSGILVFGKTPQAANSLSKQMHDKEFGKYYKALLITSPPQNTGKVIDYMKKDGRTNTSAICPQTDSQGKRASLHYEIILEPSEKEWSLFAHCDYPDRSIVTMVKVTLETGRHHQIRLQMSHLGCPIWGDTKYGNAPDTQSQWQNIALCAYKLEFIHPVSKKKLTFEL